MDINQQVAIENAVMRIVCGDSRSYGGAEMIFIGIVAFSVVCSILKIRIESFLFAFPFMMIAAYFFFRWPILDCYRNSDFYPFRRT